MTGSIVGDSLPHPLTSILTIPLDSDLSVSPPLQISPNYHVYPPSLVYKDWFEPWLTSIWQVYQKFHGLMCHTIFTQNCIDRRTNISQKRSLPAWQLTELWIHYRIMSLKTNLCNVLHRFDVGYSRCKIYHSWMRSSARYYRDWDAPYTPTKVQTALLPSPV